MADSYKRLVLDPRCLKPAHQTNDRFVYIDAIDAINEAIDYPHITQSEMAIIEQLKSEIRKNRFDTVAK